MFIRYGSTLFFDVRSQKKQFLVQEEEISRQIQQLTTFGTAMDLPLTKDKQLLSNEEKR